MAGDGGRTGARPSSAGQKSLDVIDLADESDESASASKASTKIGDRSVGGAASSAEDEGGTSKVEPKRHSPHPPHPGIATARARQVRLVESGEFLIS